MCGKKMSNIFITLKKICLGVFRYRGEEEDGNETSLKEEGGIEIENLQVAFHIRDALALSFAFCEEFLVVLLFIGE